MDLIGMTKALAKALQQDERYLAFHLARANNDDDAALQEAIGQFNLKRIDLNNELSKEPEETNAERITALNTEIRELYSQIMESENMNRYTETKNELDVLLNQIQHILTEAANGADVDLIDLTECTHDCSTCGGCH